MGQVPTRAKDVMSCTGMSIRLTSQAYIQYMSLECLFSVCHSGCAPSTRYRQKAPPFQVEQHASNTDTMERLNRKRARYTAPGYLYSTGENAAKMLR